jgi:phosphoserine phosphatase
MPRLIVFDVDSTLLRVETLDFLIERALGQAEGGAADALHAITAQGMAGEMDFRKSLEARLSITALSEALIAEAAEAIAGEATPGIATVLNRLRAREHEVYAVSGGFMELIQPALEALGFAPGEIRANRFVVEDGQVAGFDRNNPLSRSGGKGPVVASLKAQTGCDLAIIVGDGITDYEAFAGGGADAFIGFGGVTRREAVAAKAPAYADDVKALEKLLLG